MNRIESAEPAMRALSRNDSQTFPRLGVSGGCFDCISNPTK